MRRRCLALLLAALGACNSQAAARWCATKEDCAPTELCSPLGRCVDDRTGAECGAAPCAAPIVETLAPGDLSETSIVARFALAAPGNPAASNSGICWAYDAPPDTDAGSTDCLSASRADSASGEVTIGGLTPGRNIVLVAFAENLVARTVGAMVVASTLPAAPSALTATDGTSTSHVTVDWSPSPGAVAYRVFRDEREVAVIVVPPFVDSGAAPAPAPGRVADLVVSRDLPDRIELRWSPPAAIPGTTHRYHVVAEGLSGDSTASVADTGFRGGAEVLGYELSRRGGPWEPLGNVTSAVDDVRYPFTVAAYAAVARKSSGGRVDVDCVGDVRGEQLSYRVRAVAVTGAGEPSSSIGGQRSATALTHTIGRLRDGASILAPNADDFDVLSDDGRASVTVTHSRREPGFFRCTLNDLGETLTTSALAWAYPSECDVDRACDAGDAGEACVAGLCAPAGTVRVLGGRTALGAPEGSIERDSDEVLHEVTLSRDVFFAVHEVTRGQWSELLGAAPTRFAACGELCPVVNVTWDSAIALANAASTADGLAPCYEQRGDCVGSAADGSLVCSTVPQILSESGSAYDCVGWRLPTEAEWEHAARGPLGQDWEGGAFSSNESLYDCVGDSQEILHAYARYCSNSAVTWAGCSATQAVRRTCAGPIDVGSYSPTTWGLHDMYGNVAEFVWDAWRPYDLEAVTDPEAAPLDASEETVARGGSWYVGLSGLRASARSHDERHVQSSRVGLRLVRTAFD